VHGTVVARLDAEATASGSAAEDAAEDDDEPMAGPIAIAVDVNETPAESDNPAS
jgi:exoribonuclease-2